MLFFSQFSSLAEFERNSGLKFFFLFIGLSHLVLVKNNTGKRFINFLMFFFLYFFWNFLARIEYERNSGLKFCSLFLGLSHPILARNNAGSMFLIFWFFLVFFWKFSSPGRVWTEFKTKLLFYLFRPITSRFG